MSANCSTLTGSLAWCEGKTVLPGIRRRLYYVSKSDIAAWPVLPTDAEGRVTSATLTGDFALNAGKYWNYIDVLVDKSGLTSEAQGEKPSQTQLNKITAVHQGVDEQATMAAAYINNNDCVYIVEDMPGKYRVVGNELWQGKGTVAQDLGQGATGTAATTINVEHTDRIPAPFYTGLIQTGENEVVQASAQSESSEPEPESEEEGE